MYESLLRIDASLKTGVANLSVPLQSFFISSPRRLLFPFVPPRFFVLTERRSLDGNARVLRHGSIYSSRRIALINKS